MEVTERTDADRKGGHIARLREEDGRLVLRETAQTPEEDLDALQDTGRHRWMNTNNLWINLRALRSALDDRDGVLGLPMIVNRKTVDPGDKSTPEVFQLETAMGAAIGVFDGAAAIAVSRRRFAPVKSTEDLLGVRSDAYALTDEFHVTAGARAQRPAGDRPGLRPLQADPGLRPRGSRPGRRRWSSAIAWPSRATWRSAAKWSCAARSRWPRRATSS